jgi:hypothetical protein
MREPKRRSFLELRPPRAVPGKGVGTGLRGGARIAGDLRRTQREWLTLAESQGEGERRNRAGRRDQKQRAAEGASDHPPASLLLVHGLSC